MRRETQRFLAAMLTLVMLLCIAPAAFADEATEEAAVPEFLTRDNTVTVDLVPAQSSQEETEAFAEDVKTAKVQADLYLIAEAVPSSGGDLSYEYKPFEAPFQSIQESFDAALQVDDPTETITQDDVFAKFEPFAQQIASEVLKESYMQGPAASQAAGDGATTITVSGLKAGLYLMVLRGSDLTAKDNSASGYVVEKDGTLLTRAFSDNYEYLFKPQLVTMPLKTLDGEQQYGTAAVYGDWTNELTVVVKAERESRYADLVINKKLTGYVGPDNPAFSFHVVATKNGNTVLDDHTKITLTGDGTKSVTIAKRIPIGSTITVEEEYDGSRYEVVGEKTKTATLVNEQEPKDGWEVSFENKYDGTLPGGYGILNTFEKTGTSDSDWTWYKDGEAQTSASGTK